jgi:hypothetical protein
VLVEEKIDEVELDTELAEPTPFKRPPERLSWSSGGELRELTAEFLLDLRGAGGAGANVGDWGELTDESARREPARLGELFRGLRRGWGVDDVPSVLSGRMAAAEARDIVWRQSQQHGAHSITVRRVRQRCGVVGTRPARGSRCAGLDSPRATRC